MMTATDQFDDDTPLATDLQQFAHLAIIWLSFLRQRSMRSSATARRRRHPGLELYQPPRPTFAAPFGGDRTPGHRSAFSRDTQTARSGR